MVNCAVFFDNIEQDVFEINLKLRDHFEDIQVLIKFHISLVTSPAFNGHSILLLVNVGGRGVVNDDNVVNVPAKSGHVLDPEGGFLPVVIV